MARTRVSVPVNHQPAMRVTHGGSSCATCKFYNPQPHANAPFGSCGSQFYQAYYKTAAIPCPPEDFCSDWYEPTQRLPSCPRR